MALNCLKQLAFVILDGVLLTPMARLSRDRCGECFHSLKIARSRWLAQSTRAIFRCDSAFTAFWAA